MTTSEWGRVAEDGTVYVRTPDGERAVGQYPEGTPEEALAFYTKRYDELAGSVHLLEQRVQAAVLSPDEAAESVRNLRPQVVEAHAVGDLTALVGRLDALGPVISQQRQARRAERAEKTAAAKVEKERLVAEAETLGKGNDCATREQAAAASDEWKAFRIDGPCMTHCGSGSPAPHAYTRRRKADFAEQEREA